MSIIKNIKQRVNKAAQDPAGPLPYSIPSPKGSVNTFKGDDGLWYWHLKSLNRQIVCQSEGYTTRAHAKTGAETAKRLFAGPLLWRDYKEVR